MTARIQNWGRMAYGPALEKQTLLLEEVAAGAPDTLVFVEHEPVLTLGASFHAENLLLTPEEYERRGIEIAKCGRGGDVTYHGPGQLVVYPIFNLAGRGRDLHLWLRELEEALIRAAAAFGVPGYRFSPHTGVWANSKKLAAVGVRVRKWVSMHGVALNCDNDLSPFETIVPCGIQGYGTTSLTQEAGRRISVSEAAPAVADAFAEVFALRL